MACTEGSAAEKDAKDSKDPKHRASTPATRAWGARRNRAFDFGGVW
jgi:hypothetical protein